MAKLTIKSGCVEAAFKRGREGKTLMERVQSNAAKRQRPKASSAESAGDAESDRTPTQLSALSRGRK